MESPKEMTRSFCEGLIDDLRLFDLARLPLDEAVDSDSPSGPVDANPRGWMASLNTFLIAPAPAI